MLKYLPVVCVAAVFFGAAAAQTQQKAPPEQPIPYSHKKHVGELKLKCNMCHPNKDPGEIMGIPQAGVCMQCHSSVKTDSPAIQKLTEFAKAKRDIRWVRIYQIPTYVMFSHKAHLETGATCQECHGPVQEREQMFKEADISMGGCMSCHKAKNASNDCSFCHEPR
jgi:Cytochrome c7 and related cytochrome c